MLVSEVIEQLEELRAEINYLAKDFKVNELDYSGCDAVPFSDTWYDYVQDNTGFVNTDTEYYSFFTFITENINDTDFVKTSLVILTDGQENSSQEFNKASATELITKVQDKLGWDVTYLGAKAADFDSFTGSIGIKGGKAIAFDPNQFGTRSVSLNAATTMSMAYMSADPLATVDKS